MVSARTYSITEMEQISGFDRRTIVYYIQQGLLPKPGRRGPNTRYPEDCLLRLRFVRGLKDQQDQGRCGTVTLADIRGMLGILDAQALRDTVERGINIADVEQLLRPAPAPAEPAPPPAVSPTAAVAAAAPVVGDRRSYGLADAGIRQRFAGSSGTAPPPVTPKPDADAAVHEDTQPRLPALSPPAGVAPVADTRSDLGELLRELEVRPGLAGRRLAPGASEHWTEIPITSRIFLSVRGLAAEDAPLADAVARALKLQLRTR